MDSSWQRPSPGQRQARQANSHKQVTFKTVETLSCVPNCLRLESCLDVLLNPERKDERCSKCSFIACLLPKAWPKMTPRPHLCRSGHETSTCMLGASSITSNTCLTHDVGRLQLPGSSSLGSHFKLMQTLNVSWRSISQKQRAPQRLRTESLVMIHIDSQWVLIRYYGLSYSVNGPN